MITGVAGMLGFGIVKLKLLADVALADYSS